MAAPEGNGSVTSAGDVEVATNDPFVAWHAFMSACCVFLLGETVALGFFVHKHRQKQVRHTDSNSSFESLQRSIGDCESIHATNFYACVFSAV